MSVRLDKTDVVVIGLGGAGGVAVEPLTAAGLDVVGLEAGTWLAPKDFAPDELRNNYRGWPQAAQKANREIPVHRPNARAPDSPRGLIHPMMNGVGGTTLHYWAQSWRLNPWDFRVVTDTRRRYGSGRIPARSTVEDWPFGLDELEPYYDKVEYGIGVSGQAGNVKGAIDQRGNISKGRASAAIPCRRCAARNLPTRWPLPHAASVGIRFPARPRSTRSCTRTAAHACITASAAVAAATYPRKTRRPSRRFRAHRRPGASTS
jgi:gluconate 2-dehydrogenase alpha chain